MAEALADLVQLPLTTLAHLTVYFIIIYRKEGERKRRKECKQSMR